MQDLAQEIASLMEPSKPLGYRLVLFKGPSPRISTREVLFEAKAVEFKGGIGFLVRCDLTGKGQLSTLFAPTEEALKFVFRNAYNSCVCFHARLVLIPPGTSGYDGDGCLYINQMTSTQSLDLDATDPDSPQERILRELVAALTLLQVPEGLQW